MQQQRRSPWFWIVLVAGAGMVLFFFAIVIAGLAVPGTSLGGGNIAVIQVKGMIMGSGDFSLLGGGVASAESITRQLERASKDPYVKAVVLRIDSPGGTVAGSQEIYDAILRFRRPKKGGRKFVVTSMSDLAASGGYYIASATDKIIAQRGTLTGSIGVIMQTMDFEGLMKKYGVRSNVIKSGSRKDMLSPYRGLKPEERAFLQRTSDEIYGQFIRDVARGRGMKEDAVRRIADGSVVSGMRAKAMGLVDQIGGMHDAIREAANMAGVKGEPRLTEYGRVSLFERLFGLAESAANRPLIDTLPGIPERLLMRPSLPLPTVCLPMG